MLCAESPCEPLSGQAPLIRDTLKRRVGSGWSGGSAEGRAEGRGGGQGARVHLATFAQSPFLSLSSSTRFIQMSESGFQELDRSSAEKAAESGTYSTRPPPHRRRDKKQLSCDFCRRRKYTLDYPQPPKFFSDQELTLSEAEV
jgi:hypothetical protein